MKCELCGKNHDGSYGSGRFCSPRCARKFSTSINRDAINAKVSKTLKLRHQEKYGLTKKKSHKVIQNFKYYCRYLDVVELLLSENCRFLVYPNIDFDHRYLVSVDGRIISSSTFIELKYAFNKDAYKRVVLHDINGKSHLLLVHRIVAYNFIPNPNNLPIINHIDENPSNNNVSNLEWCTYKYNNTYNNVHKKRGERLKGKPAWNKGKKFRAM